jgi:hypothetical protein
MGDLLCLVVVFGSFVATVSMTLRHRYRMKLLAAAMQTPGFSHLGPREREREGLAEMDARLEGLEEKLSWVERLASDREAQAAGALASSRAARDAYALGAAATKE